MEPEICTKMLRNVSQKLTKKFHVIILSNSMVKVACGKAAFSGIFELEASPVEGQSLPQEDNKKRKRKGEKKLKKPKKPL